MKIFRELFLMWVRKTLDLRSTSRHIARMRKKKNTPKPTFTDRRIIGFSLPPGLAAQVKIEAARRGLSLRKLFEEIWTTYKNAQAR